MQRLRAVGGTFIRLEWADKTHDTIALPKGERTWQGEHLVTQSEATGRFSDACALMISAKPLAGNLNPSLQMGDAAHPVRIYFWDATRGPGIMEATGRETTKRTGQAPPSTWRISTTISFTSTTPTSWSANLRTFANVSMTWPPRRPLPGALSETGSTGRCAMPLIRASR